MLADPTGSFTAVRLILLNDLSPPILKGLQESLNFNAKSIIMQWNYYGTMFHNVWPMLSFFRQLISFWIIRRSSRCLVTKGPRGEHCQDCSVDIFTIKM